jgi:hypothetical protein
MTPPADAAASSPHFARCTLCRRAWKTRAEFLADPHLRIIGYQVAFHNLANGLFLFNHSCGTTLARPVGAFQDLYDGPVFASRATGSDECPGFCLRKDELRGCPAQCECAYVRAIIQLLLDWPKPGGQQDTGHLPHLIG